MRRNAQKCVGWVGWACWLGGFRKYIEMRKNCVKVRRNAQKCIVGLAGLAGWVAGLAGWAAWAELGWAEKTLLEGGVPGNA